MGALDQNVIASIEQLLLRRDFRYIVDTQVVEDFGSNIPYIDMLL